MIIEDLRVLYALNLELGNENCRFLDITITSPWREFGALFD